MKKIILFIQMLIILAQVTNAQHCTPAGNQTSYGTNNKWRGYVYNNKDLTSYKGYVIEGSTSSPDFDENFGGSNVSYPTNGCDVQTETFSVRYKLTKSFASGSYRFTVGGDDGYRLSLDGGNTWVIDKWVDQSYAVNTYTTALSGSYDMVLEYYENGGDNRISFSVVSTGCGTENTAIYGTDNTWNGYLYDGINFDSYFGMIHAGNAADASFTEDFGGSAHNFGTSGCDVYTETFSARYRLTKTFANNTYSFNVGGDDGYRLSIDGGNTWLINNWTYHSYLTSSATVHLNGTYDLVLEYFEGSGDNTLTFFVQTGTVLAVKLLSFNGRQQGSNTELTWDVTTNSDPDHFEIEKSQDGINFKSLNTISGSMGVKNVNSLSYSYVDNSQASGVLFYRLKMVDMSGKINYSNTISINMHKNDNNSIKVFPTLVTNNMVWINSTSQLNDAVIKVIDLNGKAISTKHYGKTEPGQSVAVQLSTTHLPNGIYLVSITDENKLVSTHKIMIQ